jgi:small subunit ribosomal protein S7
MPPRLHLDKARSSGLRIWPARRVVTTASAQLAQRRRITANEKPLPITDQPKGPNQEQLPHVSEEAAAVEKTMGGEGPDIGQGTPVQEVRQDMITAGWLH